jgi:transposase
MSDESSRMKLISAVLPAIAASEAGRMLHALGKKTMEVEILKEAVEYGQSLKMDSARALFPKDGE